MKYGVKYVDDTTKTIHDSTIFDCLADAQRYAAFLDERGFKNVTVYVRDSELSLEKPDDELPTLEPVTYLYYDLTDDGTGKKYDTGKPLPGTALRIFSSALLGIGACIAFGKKKYPKVDNWKLVDDGLNRYTDSLIRHLTKFHAGEEFDPETKLPHLFHCGWNMLAIIEFYIKEHPELLEDLLK